MSLPYRENDLQIYLRNVKERGDGACIAEFSIFHKRCEIDGRHSEHYRHSHLALRKKLQRTTNIASVALNKTVI